MLPSPTAEPTAAMINPKLLFQVPRFPSTISSLPDALSWRFPGFSEPMYVETAFCSMRSLQRKDDTCVQPYPVVTAQGGLRLDGAVIPFDSRTTRIAAYAMRRFHGVGLGWHVIRSDRAARNLFVVRHIQVCLFVIFVDVNEKSEFVNAFSA